MPVSIKQVLETPWTILSPIRVGEIPLSLGTPDVFVLFEDDEGTRLRIDVYADRSEEHICFKDAVLWHNLVAVGFGHKLYLIPIDKSPPTTIDLGSYFGHFYQTDDLLLVATAEQLRCFETDGSQIWSSPKLGIDGVIVCSVKQDIIYGEGEWDPPGGWEPFIICIKSGELVKP